MPGNNVAIVIHNLILFETLQPLLEQFRNNNIAYDIYVPMIEDEQWRDMANDTYMQLISLGYNPQLINKVPAISYKIAMYPYLPYYVEVDAQYKVRYQYGMAKPTWNLDTWSVYFDLIFCNGRYDYSFLKAYTQSVITGPLKFANFKRTEKNLQEWDKLNILYLPTYGPECSIEEIQEQLIRLKEKHHVRIKLHHGTTYLEKERVAIAKSMCNELLDHRTSLVALLQDTDVIISDGSGAIFDAVMTDTPLVVFQPKTPAQFEGILALEEQIIKNNIVSHVNEATDLEQAIKNAVFDDSYIQRRRDFRLEQFPIIGNKTLDICMTQILKLLTDDLEHPNYVAHNRLGRKIRELENVRSSLHAENLELANRAQILDHKLSDLETTLDAQAVSIVFLQDQKAILEKQTATHLDEINFLERQISNHVKKNQEQVDTLNRVIAQNELRSIQTNQEIEEYRREIVELKDYNRRLEHELSNIYNSKRWRGINLLRQLLIKTKFIFFIKAYSTWKHYGFGVLWKKILNKLRKHQNKESFTSHNQEEYLSWYEYKFLNYKKIRNERYLLNLEHYSIPFTKELVSVVLPVYNGEDMIAEAIESILQQTYTNFELIIINDGSRDKTPDIIEEYAEKDSRIRIVHQENCKIPRTLSRGFRMAQGEFLTWTSADNNLHSDFLERLVSELKADPQIGMVYSNMRLIDDKGQLIINHGWYEEPKGSSIVNLPKSVYELNVYPNNTIGAAFMYRAKVAYVLGDYSIYKHTLEDYDYWMRVNDLFQLKHVSFNEPIYDYRFHDKSLTAQDKELGITANRYKLMILDDYRRDFFLSPLLWVFQGEDSIIESLRRLVESKGHMIFNNSYQELGTLNLGTPVIYVSTDNIQMENIESAFKVFLSKAAPADQHFQPGHWNMAVTFDESVSLPKLEDHKGWYLVDDCQTLFAMIDAKAKTYHSYLIEGNIEKDRFYEKKLSIIICTYKRSERLRNALISTINQSMSKDDYEIIIVNNDIQSQEIAELLKELKSTMQLGDHFLKYAVSPHKGLSFARNTGMFEARGEVLLFVDDDAIADHTLAEATHLGFFHHPEAGVIGGNIVLNRKDPLPEIVRPGSECYWSQLIIEGEEYKECNYEWEFPYGANFAVRTNLLMRMGGFRTSYGRKGNDFAGGEEIVVSFLAKEMGFKIGLNPKSRVIHDVDSSRYTTEHIKKTMRASILTHYQLQKDLYASMEFDLEYDESRIQLLKQEIDVLKNKPETEVNPYDLLYKQYQLEAYEELLQMKYNDIDKRRRLKD